MYPNLSYFLHDLFGTQPDNVFSIIQTFGLFLVLAILVAAWMLRLELQRKEAEGLLPARVVTIPAFDNDGVPWDILWNALFGLFLGMKVGYAVTHFAEFQADAAGTLLSFKGNLVAGFVGMFVFGGLRYMERKRLAVERAKPMQVTIRPSQHVGDMAIIAGVAGIIGAKLFAMFEDFSAFAKGTITWSNFMSQFFSGSGLAIYGGLIVAFIVEYWYVKRKGMKPIHVMDAVAPALIVAYAVGRIGCQLSGDGDWGLPNTAPNPGWIPQWLWAYDYPHNVVNEGIPIPGCTWQHCMHLREPVYPTPIYEVFLGLMIGGILWSLRKRIKIPGIIFFLYLIFNGLERFFIEKIRVNIRNPFLGFEVTQAEVIALLLVLTGIVGIAYLWWKNKNSSAVQTS